MKHWQIEITGHHNTEKSYKWETKNDDIEKVVVEALYQCLDDGYCVDELPTKDIKEQIEKAVATGKPFALFFPYEEEDESGLMVWVESLGRGKTKWTSDCVNMGAGPTSDGTMEGLSDKYENAWASISFIKEQLETVTYIAQDEDIARLDDMSIPEVVEMGVFRYAGKKNLVVESL